MRRAEDLRFIATRADMFGYSFGRTPADVPVERPHRVEGNILRRMQTHQHKKSAMLRDLRLANHFFDGQLV